MFIDEVGEAYFLSFSQGSVVCDVSIATSDPPFDLSNGSDTDLHFTLQLETGISPNYNRTAYKGVLEAGKTLQVFPYDCSGVDATMF